ncbi:MAG TPA: Uma2 family endonuclease, partial [Planctomycetaceae bacterium]|nr:Uma2 family endonuclease [Planctomycetaceae bacterium]
CGGNAMSTAQILPEIEYPESDGKPVAETEIHFEWITYVRDVLKFRYRGQRVYVGANLLVYYVPGDPRKSFAPDDFVVKDCEPGLRRTFRIWDEQRTPDVVFEITSSSTRREDQGKKPKIYARIGVKELFLYDPTCDYLNPPLQGFRFENGRKVPIQPDASGALECRELGLLLRLEERRLVFFDARTGERLLTEAEAAEARARAAEDRASSAEHRASTAEEEVRRLREELARARQAETSSDE